MTYVEPIFQIETEDQFRVKFVVTTIEECTDVTYTRNEINDHFNGGEDINSMDDTEPTDSIVGDFGYQLHMLYRLDNIVNYVLSQLETNKTVPALFYMDSNDTRFFNIRFKQSGIIFSHHNQEFKNWKAPKLKAKVVTVPARLMNDLRMGSVCVVERFIRETYQVETNIKGLNTKVGQHN